MKKHIKIDDDLNLVIQKINSNTTVEVVKSINHLIIVDVSGSMYYDLPEIRKNLKNKISSLVKENDTITIIWFSGRNDAGILKEEVRVNSLKQLNDLNDAIDRFLKPVGMTAFAKPLELVDDVIERIGKNNPNSVFSFVFFSDGYNNDCSWSDVMTAVNKISPKLSSSVVVEYGFYADSRRLSELAGALGGEKISCSGFEEYDVVIGNSFNKNVSGGKKVVVDIQDKYLHDFAFSVTEDRSVLVYNIVDNQVTVGSDIKELYFFSPDTCGVADSGEHTMLYAAIYVLSDKMLNDDAERIFYALGDNHYYQMLANAFGKQKLNAFKSAIKECVVDVSKRFPRGGMEKIQKVDDNAYCLMNLISDLGSMGAMFVPSHDDFNYNRIGRKKVAVGSTLTDSDKERLAEAKNVNEAQAILKEFEDKKVDLKFVSTYPDKAYPLTDLVWNEERANLSVRIYIEGEVSLPDNKYGIDKVSTFKYNTFTLIKDGILNVTKLPIKYNDDVVKLAFSQPINVEVDKDYMIIDLASLPIINRRMVKDISANELAKLEWKLIKLQGDKKVYDYYRKQLFPKTSKSFTEMLGQECADWLKEIGITDFNGFAPKTTQAESTDFYMSVNLQTKIKGLSSLPKVEDVLKKITAGSALKLNEWVMSDAINKYIAHTNSELFSQSSDEQKLGMLKTYLETKSDILNTQKRRIMQQIAEIKFALILSKRWFTEYKSFDENKLSLVLDEQNLEFTFDLSEKEVKI